MRVEDSCVDHEAALFACFHPLIFQVALALATGVCGHQLESIPDFSVLSGECGDD